MIAKKLALAGILSSAIVLSCQAGQDLDKACKDVQKDQACAKKACDFDKQIGYAEIHAKDAEKYGFPDLAAAFKKLGAALKTCKEASDSGNQASLDSAKQSLEKVRAEVYALKPQKDAMEAKKLQALKGGEGK